MRLLIGLLAVFALLIAAPAALAWDDIYVRDGAGCTVFLHVISSNHEDGLSGQTGHVLLARLNSRTGRVTEAMSVNQIVGAGASKGLYTLKLTAGELRGVDFINGQYQSKKSDPAEFTIRVIHTRVGR